MFILFQTKFLARNIKGSYRRHVLIADLETIINIQFVGILTIYIPTEFHMPDYNSSLVIVMKPKYECIIHAATILLPYILQKKGQQKLSVLQNYVTMHNYRIIH